MYYYEVIPASKSFHGKEPLAYCSEEKLLFGQIVYVDMRSSSCLAVIIQTVSKPSFNTLEIKKVLNGAIIPGAYLSLMQWMIGFYPGPLGTIAQLFIPNFLTGLSPGGNQKSNKAVSFKGIRLPGLTEEQSVAYKTISGDKSNGNHTYIVHGVTGSGKTRLYIELAKESLSKNKSVIVLTPEISLTAPIANQFKKIFGDILAINHSSLAPRQRVSIWAEAFAGKRPMIIIGPRSSLFIPLKNIGLIVVDEFHEPAYKQESQPFYHASRVASMLSKLTSAKLIFGSATPPVIDYFLAQQKKVPVIEMSRSAISGKKPGGQYTVVNLLDKDEKSSYPLISKTLIVRITEALDKNEQAMLFINKRGSARSISCQDCGHRELCKNCDLAMVYHEDQHLIRCHTCGTSKTPPSKCPDCGSLKIFFSSPGTKAIAANLSKLFPKAKVARYDRDNKKSERLENDYDKAVNDVDIIVGTQTIAKGHDLPRLSLVAMLLAENSLDFPDYSSLERSYQLIKQLSGRVNRGHRDGMFLIQTFNPKSKFIQSALTGPWRGFYDEEISQRKRHGFPPFYAALKIESARGSRKSAEQSLDRLVDKLGLKKKNLELLGPTPSFIEKKSGKWHWQIIIKSKNRSELVNIAKVIPSSFKIDIDPSNFL
jgi:primosomal protein N' (replication factor Y)